jgi:superfamily II DNA helicase RecQ
MPYHIITTRFNPTTQTFPSDAINAFEMNKRILNKYVSFFEHDQNHYWSIFLEYELVFKHREKDNDDTKSLDDREKEVYEKLKAWRNETAQKEGVPPYVIAKNKDMAIMVERKITTSEALRQIHGFGDKKLEKYGREILDITTSFFGKGP